MSSITLYTVTDTLAALVDSLDMCETDELRAQCEAEIQRTVQQQVQKVDDFHRFLVHLESQIELAGKEIDRLKARRDHMDAMIERLKDYAVRVMSEQNLTRLEGDTVTFSLRQNPPAVEITDEAAVPAVYKTVVQTVKVDKRAIGKELKAGRDVPGADLRFGSVSLVRK